MYDPIDFLNYLTTMNMAQTIFIVTCFCSLFFPVRDVNMGKMSFFGFRTVRFISDFCIVFTSLASDSILVQLMRIIKFGSDLRLAVMTNPLLFDSKNMESKEIKVE